MQDELKAPSGPPTGEGRYLLVVGGLMMVILVLLAALWLRERANARAARADVARLRSLAGANLLAGGGGVEDAIRKALAARAPAARGVQREDLPSEMVDWNGRPRRVLHVSSAAGTRLGLLPGDVLVVASERAGTGPDPNAPDDANRDAGDPNEP